MTCQPPLASASPAEPISPASGGREEEHGPLRTRHVVIHRPPLASASPAEPISPASGGREEEKRGPPCDEHTPPPDSDDPYLGGRVTPNASSAISLVIGRFCNGADMTAPVVVSPYSHKGRNTRSRS